MSHNKIELSKIILIELGDVPDTLKRGLVPESSHNYENLCYYSSVFIDSVLKHLSNNYSINETNTVI